MTEKEFFEHTVSNSKFLPVGDYSSQGLAFIGDAVYGMLLRAQLMKHGSYSAKELNALTAKRECAAAQAEAYRRLEPVLSEAELLIMKRGRNTKTNSRAKNASIQDYRLATGVEALFGHLFIANELDRLFELFEIGVNN